MHKALFFISQTILQTSRIIAAGGDFSTANALAAAGVSTDVQSTGAGGNVLRAIIEKMYYQITVDILHQVSTVTGPAFPLGFLKFAYFLHVICLIMHPQ